MVTFTKAYNSLKGWYTKMPAKPYSGR